jgi:flagellin
MAFGGLSRINTNLQAMQSLQNFKSTNNQLSSIQERLSTGKRINSAGDDAAGYSIARKIESRVRGQSQAQRNIGDAQSLLNVTEGAMQSSMESIQRIKELAVQGANDTLGENERKSIEDEMLKLSAEIDDTLGNAEFNGKSLIASTGSGINFNFQVNADSSDTLAVTISAMSAGGLGVGAASISNGGATLTATDFGNIMDQADTAIQTLSSNIADLGATQNRLDIKADNLETAKTNNEAARSQLEDTDFAKEQMELTKLQIVQQSNVAQLAQANSAPQTVLSLFG